MALERGVRRFVSESPEATRELGARLAARLPDGAVVALSGELGAGKTAFVQGMGRGLGLDELVTSPTFTLLHEYGTGDRPLHHFDAWMAGREAAFLEDGGDTYLGGPGVAAVEWAERVADQLPLPRLEVRLEHLAEERRAVRVSVLAALEGGDEGLQAALEAVVGALELPEGLEEAPEKG
jgi:tRNA threonylcarbamoyladenosine biosynthesis protein TsaE